MLPDTLCTSQQQALQPSAQMQMAHLDGANDRQPLQEGVKCNPDATLDLERLHAHLNRSTS